MERIKIQLPEQFLFTTTIPIRIGDVNYGGHVGNDAFLSLIHEARMQFLASFGWSELNMAGVALIMADVGIEYKHELKYGDVVTAHVTVQGIDRLGFDVVYHLTVNKNNTIVTAAKAKTGMLCFDYNAGKKQPVPDAAIQAFSSTNQL